VEVPGVGEEIEELTRRLAELERQQVEAAAIESRDPADDLTADEVIEASFIDWFETCAAIRNDMGEVIRAPDKFEANELQQKIDEAVTWCEVHRQPCRLMVLKPRKEGSTTCLVGKSYHLCRSSQAQLLQIGDEYKTTQTMWTMLRTFQEEDGHEWVPKVTQFTADAKTGQAEWEHGASAWTDTAGDRRAGQSKTPTVIHCEEVAHWGKDGAAASAGETMLALLNSVRDVYGTYVFVSSTANGIGNWYYRTYSGAVSLEQRKAGEEGNGWIKVFMPWYRSKWSSRKVPEEGLGVLTAREALGQEKYGWTLEQVCWRRFTIKNRCDGDESKFDQEYPEDEIGCFLHSGKCKFDMMKLKVMKERAASVVAYFGRLNLQESVEYGDSVSFEPTSVEEHFLKVWEYPVDGCRYLIACDPMTGISQTVGEDPDAHAVFVMRAGYFDSTAGRWRPPMVCARLRHGAQWDIDILEVEVWKLSLMYGRCIIVPEMNADRGMVEMGLKKRGANIYERQEWNRRENRVTGQLGWMTRPENRGAILDGVARVVREQGTEGDGLDLFDVDTIGEMETFVTKPSGKAEAMSGCHDDTVLALAIGLACIGSCTMYRVQRRKMQRPADWKKWKAAGRRGIGS
jgi:hypothetical protein